MANTTNYGWPLPDPQGIQMTEIGRIVDALDDADGTVSGLAALIAGLTFAAVGGQIGDGQLPPTLRATASDISNGDWNDAVRNGWFAGSNVANAPQGSSDGFLGHVEVYAAGAGCTQTVHAFTTDGDADTKVWRRELNGGNWTDWYRLRWSETEIAAMITTAVTAAVNGLLGGVTDALNTLGKLASSIGGDANFSATVAAQMATRLGKSEQAADSAKLGGQAPDHYQVALGYTPVNKAGDTMTGGLALGGNLALKSSYGAEVFSDGNGDAASYETYNVKVQGWNGWGFASYDGTIKGVYDFRNGIWDVKGGYRVNGVAVPIANGGTYNMSVSGSAGSVGGVQLGNLVRNYSGGNTISFDWNGTLTLHIDNTDFGDNLPCNITGSAGSVGGVSNPASAGALVQYQSGIVEFGPVGSGGTLDLPSPYVMTGLRQAPSSVSTANEYIRARALKNQ